MLNCFKVLHLKPKLQKTEMMNLQKSSLGNYIANAAFC